MPAVARVSARDPRLVVLPVIGLFLGLMAGLFVADARTVPEAAAAVIRPPDPADVRPTPAQPAGRVSRPVEIRIPAIDVAARIVPRGLNVDGSMQVPDFGLAGWYRLGPRPGEAGPAVVVAHVDSQAGPDVFARLDELRPGDEVTVVAADGSATRWVMTAAEQTPKDELPVARIWAPTTSPVLRLITCGGVFDEATGHYVDNLIVYAEPAA